MMLWLAIVFVANASPFIDQLPFEVRIAAPNSYPGTNDGGMYGCNVEGGFFGQVMARAGIDGLGILGDLLGSMGLGVGLDLPLEVAHTLKGDLEIFDTPEKRRKKLEDVVNQAHAKLVNYRRQTGQWRSLGPSDKINQGIHMIGEIIKDYKLDDIVTQAIERSEQSCYLDDCLTTNSTSTTNDSRAVLKELMSMYKEAKAVSGSVINGEDTFWVDKLIYSIPDPMTGLLTSRAVGNLLNGIIMPNRDNPIAGPLDAPSANMGVGMCLAARIQGSELLAENYRDALVALVSGVIGCNASGKQDCDNLPTRQYDLYSSDCELLADELPTDIDDTSKIPVSIDLLPLKEANIENDIIPKATADIEGKVYFYLFMALSKMAVWVPYSECGKMLDNMQPIPGWNIKRDLWIREAGGAAEAEAIPFTQIAEGADCNFLLLNRGTNGDFEWAIDVDVGQTPIVLENSPEGDYRVHRGVYSMAAANWDNVREYFIEDALPRCPTLNLTIAGHSLGGGMSQIWSLLLADFFTPLQDRLSKPIQTVFMSPLRVFNQATSDYFYSLPHVNPRTTYHEYDVVPQVPCQQMPRVQERDGVGCGGTGTEFYAAHRNTYAFTSEELMALDERTYYYQDFGFINLLPMKMSSPITINMAATHICAYECWGSSKFCTEDPNKRMNCEFTTATGQCGPKDKNVTTMVSASCHNATAGVLACAI